MVRSSNSKQQRQNQDGGGMPAFASSSQESNGAASSSSSESIQTKLGRAKEIEDSLLEALRSTNNQQDPTSTTTTKRNSSSTTRKPPPPPSTISSTAILENKSSSLRLQLCGILSDVILVDPTVAADVDAIGRMWKGCFYTRINDLRSRIIKEKSRAKRRREGGGAGVVGSGERGGGGDDDRRIADVEKQLSTFLNESVQLYNYIIGRYVEELTPPTQSQSQQSQKSDEGTNDYDDDNDNDDESSKRRLVRIIVKSLHRMHIHLGDLHRYSSQYDTAKICYLRASRLAPGSGNAYNQLAVVAQTSSNKGGSGNDMTVEALYYYARSLVSSCDIFETSRANLSRLYDNNRKWLEEHTRDDNDNDDDNIRSTGRRELIDPITGKHMTKTKREEKELILQRRAIANRKILSHFVDMQYDYIRGIAIVEPFGRVDDMTDGLFMESKAASLLTAFREAIIVNVSFSDSLLCKLVTICAYTTLGAGNDGRLISKNNGGSNIDDVTPDQALAFSFTLRFCAMLAEDVDAVLAKRHTSVRLGSAIRSFTSLLLGLRFVLTLYNDGSSCEWFHAISYFHTSNETSENKGISAAIRDICEKSHICFWSAIAKFANRLDAILSNDTGLNNDDNEGIKPVELVDVKDFDDYRGFIPFASFLDTGDVVMSGKGRAKLYATADEAIHALAESNKSQGSSGSGTNKGGRGGADASSTRTKINLFLSIVDGPMGLCVLRRNGEANEREVISRDEVNNDADLTPPSPNFTSFNAYDDAATDRMDFATSVTAPLKSPYADIGVELLTPAALLAGSAIYSPAVSVAANNESTKLPLASALIDTILEWPSNVNLPLNLNMAPTRNTNSLLNISHVNQPNTMLKMPLPPPPGLLPPPGLSAPPGFSIQPQQVHQQQPYSSNTGISLSELPASIQYEQSGGGMQSRAGPFETMNPFVQQQACLPLSFNQNYFTASNPPSGLTQQHVTNIGGFDPTLDFLLGDGLRSQQPTPDEMASSDHFNLLLPTSSTEDDQSESILNFLFNSNNDSSPSRQPLYATSQRSQHRDLPSTKNPFAT